jgi:ribosomal subunit interface protein
MYNKTEAGMSVQIEGHGIEVGESLAQRAKDAVSAMARKYGIDIVASNVVFSPSPHKKTSCSVMVEIKGREVFAKKDGADAYDAFGCALADAERQLLKEKEKLRTTERK